MKSIKLEIRKILFELFDKLEMPKDIKKINIVNGFINKFQYEGVKYGVEFTRFDIASELMAPDVQMRNLIAGLNSKYSVSFGVLDDSDMLSDDIMTNQHSATKVIGYVFSIIIDFINKNNVEVFSYYSSNKRDLIYEYLYDKYLKNDFKRYTAKEMPGYNRYFIKNK